jgi:hypothetical protein
MLAIDDVAMPYSQQLAILLLIRATLADPAYLRHNNCQNVVFCNRGTSRSGIHARPTNIFVGARIRASQTRREAGLATEPSVAFISWKALAGGKFQPAPSPFPLFLIRAATRRLGFRPKSVFFPPRLQIQPPAVFLAARPYKLTPPPIRSTAASPRWLPRYFPVDSPLISSRIRRVGWYLFVETHGVCTM